MPSSSSMYSYRASQRQPLPPRLDRSHDRISTSQHSSFRLDRNNGYRADLPHSARNREEYNPYSQPVSSYDQFLDEERRQRTRTSQHCSNQGSAYHLSTREQYDPFNRVVSDYDRYIREQDRRQERKPYVSRIDRAASAAAHIRPAPRRRTNNEIIQQTHDQHESSSTRSPLSSLDKYQNTISTLDEWEDSSEDGSDQMDIEGSATNIALPKFTPLPTPEKPFCEPRFLPLCRAIKTCLNKSYYALAEEVEEKLLRDDVNVFHKIDLDSFRQYVFEAKKSGAPVCYTQNVDDQITRLYFCLTRNMMDAFNNMSQSTGKVIGPKLEARYMPLYQAMRKSINDEGYSPGHKVEDALLVEDWRLFDKLGVDSLREYLQQARINRSPIDFPSDVDYVEKIWFCPTDGMLIEPLQSDLQPQTEFCVMGDDNDEEQDDDDETVRQHTRNASPPARRQYTPSPISIESRDEKDSKENIVKTEKREFVVKEEPTEAAELVVEAVQTSRETDFPPMDRRQETPEAEDREVSMRRENTLAVKIEVMKQIKMEVGLNSPLMPTREEILAMSISEERRKLFELALSLMNNHSNSGGAPIAATAVAGLLEYSVEQIEAMVIDCNCICSEHLLISWVPEPGPQHAMITMVK